MINPNILFDVIAGTERGVNFNVMGSTTGSENLTITVDTQIVPVNTK